MKIRLNLIPQSRKEEIEQIYRFRKFLKWEFELAGILLVFVGMLFSINYILKINLFMVANEVENSQNNNAQYKEIAKYDSEIKSINLRLNDIDKLKAGQLYWSKVMVKLNRHVSTEIEITNLTTKNYTMFLAGKARGRDNLIAFKDDLSKEECFAEINLPLSNLVSKENVDFKMDFKIKKECLK